MTRLILSSLFVSGFPDIAGAHTLAGAESLLSQMHHQIVGLHHLPLTLILILGGSIVIRRHLQNNSR
jgi:hypothetical protein